MIKNMKALLGLFYLIVGCASMYFSLTAIFIGDYGRSFLIILLMGALTYASINIAKRLEKTQ